MAKYPPYVNAYGNIPKLFEQIKAASVPTKYTNDYIYSVLGLKSTSYRPLIPLLKHLGFLDQGNVPTQAYKDFRDDARSKQVLATQIKSAYADLYQAHEYAHKLKKDELLSKLKTLTGAAKDDKTISAVAGTFTELCKLADFDSPVDEAQHKEPAMAPKDSQEPTPGFSGKVGLSYTINLNLPATTDIEVFNAIFKSLKDNLL